MPKADRLKLLPAPKQIRFAALVKTCGKPETMTLWIKPQSNPPFQKAIRENRVLTVVLKSNGNRPDFGETGFHQRCDALYLVFPKALPKSPDSRIVGIKYDLIEERPVREPAGKMPAPKKEAKPRKIPSRAAPIAPGAALKKKSKTIPPKKFEVTIQRTASVEVKTIVHALNLHDAEAGALQAVDKMKFKPANITGEIKAIAEI
jgi:hypothetical protein